MKKIACLLMMCACILTPRAARADDGGFWDMLWNWHTKFSGYGTDIHLYCKNDKGEVVQHCDEWFTNIWHNPFKTAPLSHKFVAENDKTGNIERRAIGFSDIRHEVNLRVSVMHSYGERVPGGGDEPKVWALKTMGFYYYRVSRHVDLGAGAGTIDLFGDNVERTWRPVFTGSLVVGLGGAWFARVEQNYYWGTLTGANFGHPEIAVASEPKWAPSVSLGIDFRRR
jgi:hypothetical protein